MNDEPRRKNRLPSSFIVHRSSVPGPCPRATFAPFKGGLAVSEKDPRSFAGCSVLLVVVLLALAGGALLLVKPYDTPEFVEIGSSESAFLIPLEGDTTNQAAFHSVQFLDQKKVAAKR